MGLVVKYWPKGWSVELTRFHRPNVVRCDIVTSRKRTPLIGAYLSPSTLEHLLDLEDYLTRFLDQDPIVIGGLKTNIGQAQKLLRQYITDMLMEFGLVDLLHHF